MPPTVISIEGNIGSGKSTFVNLVKDYFTSGVLNIEGKDDTSKSIPILFLEEPVNIWNEVKDNSGNTILSLFYQDQKKWSFCFQMMAYISRLSLLKKTILENPNSIIITERSVLTDKFVFAQMLYDKKMINEIEFQIYLKWFDEFISEINIENIIYLNTNPNKCNERIIKRNRKGETISLDYLLECDRYHNLLCEQFTNKLVINSNEDLNNDINLHWITQVLHFINEIVLKKTELETIKNVEESSSAVY